MTDTAPLILLSEADRVLTVSLNRPAVRNAFDASLIAELTRCLEEAATRDDLVGLVVRGEGKSFCAGADLNWMKQAASFGEAENTADAKRLSAMFQALRDLPFLTVARVHGAALGGGGGLVAAADVAIATHDALFGFTEVRLGIIPAVISPFVLEKIGATAARRYFATGEFFDGRRAEKLGLVSEAVSEDELDSTVLRVLDAVRAVGPQASRAAKALISEVLRADQEDVHTLTARRIAQIRGSVEAQEGMAAFLDKRPAAWRKEHP